MAGSVMSIEVRFRFNVWPIESKNKFKQNQAFFSVLKQTEASSMMGSGATHDKISLIVQLLSSRHPR